MATKVTPVQLAKRLGIRPQQIFNWLKQGCPGHKIGGKNYVDPDEVSEWRDGREEQKATRQKEAAQKKDQSDKVGRDASEALGKFKPHKVEHWCPKCEKSTVFLCDLMFVGDPMDNYVTAYCTICRDSRALQPNIPNEFMKEVLLEGLTLWVPCMGLGGSAGCQTHVGHEHTLLKYEDGNLEFCKECGFTIDHEQEKNTLVRRGSALGADPKDVKPYVPDKEDRKTVMDDKLKKVAAEVANE